MQYMNTLPATSNSRHARVRGAMMIGADAVDYLSGRVHEFHRAISNIPFKILGAIPGVNVGSAPTRIIHDSITDGVYTIVRSTAHSVFSTAQAALHHSANLSSAPLIALSPPQASAGQDNAVAILSGFVGDHLSQQRNPLRVRYGIYERGNYLRPTTENLRGAFPQATPKIAVFMHGLCGNEHVWELFQQPGDAQSAPYGTRLTSDLGYTPLYLRYNSGLRISLNGRHGARLLGALFDNWPVPVEEIVLIGHSMGGLLARSMADIGAVRGANWMSALKQIICLGTPHLGAPLERFVHLATHAMHRVSLTAPLARLLDARSLGIKDLRWGYSQDRERKQRDPDAFWTQDRMQSAPVPGVRYRFFGTCLTADPGHPLSRAVGDGLVQVPSSLATDVADADSSLRTALHHMRLLNHPDVYDQLLRWLGEDFRESPSFSSTQTEFSGTLTTQ